MLPFRTALLRGPYDARAPGMALAMACLYASLGVVLPFLPRWLAVERELTGAEIGVVLSLPQMMRIGVGALAAHWADSVIDRRTPLRMLSWAALVSYVAYFVIPHGFWPLLAFGFVALSLSQSVTPLVEGGLLRATAQGSISYGLARGLGSLAFIVANVSGGLLIARFGVHAAPVWIVGTLFLFALSCTLTLRPDPAPARTNRRTTGPVASTLALLRQKRFFVLIVACGLIQSGHAFYYGFSTLVWRGQGLSPATVGWLWAAGVVAEVVLLWSLPLVERRLSPEAMIVVGATGGAMRWLLMGFAPVGFALWPLQIMHALSFAAAHVGAMRLLYRETPEASAGLGQTLYAGLSSGLFMGLSMLGSGVLYDHIGAHGYWAMAAIAAAGGALALLLWKPTTHTLAAGEHPP